MLLTQECLGTNSARANDSRIPEIRRAAAPDGNLNPLYIALGTSDKRHFMGKTVLHEFIYYGVSLAAIVLSAEERVQKPPPNLETDKMTVWLDRR
jgi:hypothetical protein